MSTVKRDRLAQQSKRRAAEELAREQQRAARTEPFEDDTALIGRHPMTPEASQPGEPGKGRTR